ncbi:hypothetical protein Scep_025192 [Stephania cephalantha]|uniref:Uncharacterized protein n=1 Tax=Stephania cephalantha TaxID=152367 RepID=A0AAP0ENE5_9MAGN
MHTHTEPRDREEEEEMRMIRRNAGKERRRHGRGESQWSSVVGSGGWRWGGRETGPVLVQGRVGSDPNKNKKTEKKKRKK